MEITLQDLINAAQSAADGTDPKDAVAALLAEHAGRVDVAALQREAVDAFNELRDSGADTEDSVAAVEALVVVVEGTRLEQDRLD